MTPEEQLATAQERIRELEGLYLEAAIDAYLDPKTGTGPEKREQLWAEYRPGSTNNWQVFTRDSRAPSGIAVRGAFTTHYLLPYVRAAITEAVAARDTEWRKNWRLYIPAEQLAEFRREYVAAENKACAEVARTIEIRTDSAVAIEWPEYLSRHLHSAGEIIAAAIEARSKEEGGGAK